MKFIVFLSILGFLVISGCIQYSQTEEVCRSYLDEQSAGFPCEYFLTPGNLPSDYNVSGVKIYDEPDVTFGPRDGMENWWQAIYSNGEGIISVNIIDFKESYDKSENIQKINYIRDGFIENIGYGVDYYEIDNRIVVLFAIHATESDYYAFKSLLDARNE